MYSIVLVVFTHLFCSLVARLFGCFRGCRGTLVYSNGVLEARTHDNRVLRCLSTVAVRCVGPFFCFFFICRWLCMYYSLGPSRVEKGAQFLLAIFVFIGFLSINSSYGIDFFRLYSAGREVLLHSISMCYMQQYSLVYLLFSSCGSWYH